MDIFNFDDLPDSPAKTALEAKMDQVIAANEEAFMPAENKLFILFFESVHPNLTFSIQTYGGIYSTPEKAADAVNEILNKVEKEQGGPMKNFVPTISPVTVDKVVGT